MTAPTRPTRGELAILRVLWTRGPSTVRQVHEALATTRPMATGYTTTLKLTQIMTEKGPLTRTVPVVPSRSYGRPAVGAAIVAASQCSSALPSLIRHMSNQVVVYVCPGCRGSG